MNAIFVEYWPVVLGVITLIVTLAKMHANIETLKDKVSTLFELWNSRH